MNKVALVSNSDRDLFHFHSAFLAFLAAQQAPFLCFAPAGPFFKKLADQSAFLRAWEPTGWRARISFVRALRKAGAGLVHFHTIPQYLLAGAAVLFFLRNAKLLYTAESPARLGLLRRWFLRKLAASARVSFLVLAPQDRAALEGIIGRDHGRIFELRGLGIDLARFHPPKSERVMVDGQATRILFASPISVRCGLLDLRQASRILRAKKLEFEILCAHSTVEGDPLDPEEMRVWQKEGWMRWVGQVESMESLIRSAEIAVLPSAESSAPRFLLEAAASGRAIVAADSAGSREIVVHEESGLLYPPGDSSALARALERLIRDDVLRASLGHGSRLCAEGLFDARVTHEKIKSIYDSLLSQA